MAAATLTSAAPFLALLEEDDDKLKVHALKQLDSLVSQFWYQISNYIPQVEALCEDGEFDHREKASLLASKVRLFITRNARSPDRRYA
jgi:26S proteasome regulatory subunit N2